MTVSYDFPVYADRRPEMLPTAFQPDVFQPFPLHPDPMPITDPEVDNKHDTLFLDPERALDYLGPEQRHAVDGWLATSDDRETDLHYIANKGYLADVFREGDPSPERVDVLKSAYAYHHGWSPKDAHVED